VPITKAWQDCIGNADTAALPRLKLRHTNILEEVILALTTDRRANRRPAGW
jgi:hypothetical protein